VRIDCCEHRLGSSYLGQIFELMYCGKFDKVLNHERLAGGYNAAGSSRNLDKRALLVLGERKTLTPAIESAIERLCEHFLEK
jgi:hypothetical protein